MTLQLQKMARSLNEAGAQSGTGTAVSQCRYHVARDDYSVTWRLALARASVSYPSDPIDTLQATPDGQCSLTAFSIRRQTPES
jgi:hypothetical protein